MAISFSIPTNLSVSGTLTAGTLTAGNIISVELFSPLGQNLLLGTQNNGAAIEIDDFSNSALFVERIRIPAISASVGAGIDISNDVGATILTLGASSSTAAVFAGNVTVSSTLVLTSGAVTVSTMTLSGKLAVSSTTASTSTITGSATFGGGIGVAGAIYAGGAINISSTTASISTTTGALIVSGGLGLLGSINAGGSINAATTLSDQGGTLAAQRNALAPAQSWTFNKIAGAFAAATPTSSVGSFAFTVVGAAEIPTDSANFFGLWYIGPSTFGIGAGPNVACYLDNAGSLLVLYRLEGAATNSAQLSLRNFTQTYGGKTVHLAFVRKASGDPVLYVNGAAAAATVTTTGSGSWQASITGTYFMLGSIGNSLEWSGKVYRHMLLNYPLTATEALQVYQTGTLPASDINNASNTSIVTGDNSTFSSNTGYWTLNGSATIGGGVLSIPNGSTDFIIRADLLTVGKRYRFTAGTITGNMQVGVGVPTTALVSGGSVEIVATGTALTIGSPGGQTGTLDSIQIFPLGALIYPDPNQLGSGNYWYDVSGNGATITKDASVSWTLPWSGTLPPISGVTSITNITASTSTTTGALIVSGGVGVAGNLFVGGVTVLKNYTVATLPAAASYAYGTAFVSDATNAAGTGLGTAPTGGGAVVRLVYSTGAAWLLA